MDWIVCPSCRLNHRPRPDGVCPRCRTAVSAGAVAAAEPVVAALPLPEPPADAGAVRFFTSAMDDEGESTVGLRLGGAFLVANAVALVAEKFLLPAEPGAPVSLFGGMPSVLFDLAIGASLLWGSRKLLPLCLFRLLVGGVLFTALAAFRGDFFQAGLQVLLSGGLLLLLYGRPLAGKLIAGSVMVAICLGLELIGLVYVAAGGSLEVEETAAASQPAPIADPNAEQLLETSDELEGYASGIHMDLPASRWKLRDAERATADDPAAELWLVEPLSMAELRVLRFDGPSDTLRDVGNRVRTGLLENASSWEGTGAEPPFLAAGDPQSVMSYGGLLSGRGTQRGSRVHVELHARPDAIWAVVYLAPEGAFERHAEDVGDAVASLDI